MNGVAHLSEMTSLAFHGMAFIAAKNHQMPNVKEIAKEIGASEAHLSKALQRLVKVGLLCSVRGPGGGFELTKKAGEISLFDIYQAMEGAILVEGCPTQRSICPFSECIFGGMFQKFNREFEVYLKGRTLQEFNDALK